MKTLRFALLVVFVIVGLFSAFPASAQDEPNADVTLLARCGVTVAPSEEKGTGRYCTVNAYAQTLENLRLGTFTNLETGELILFHTDENGNMAVSFFLKEFYVPLNPNVRANEIELNMLAFVSLISRSINSEKDTTFSVVVDSRIQIDGTPADYAYVYQDSAITGMAWNIPAPDDATVQVWVAEKRRESLYWDRIIGLDYFEMSFGDLKALTAEMSDCAGGQGNEYIVNYAIPGPSEAYVGWISCISSSTIPS